MSVSFIDSSRARPGTHSVPSAELGPASRLCGRLAFFSNPRGSASVRTESGADFSQTNYEFATHVLSRITTLFCKQWLMQICGNAADSHYFRARNTADKSGSLCGCGALPTLGNLDAEHRIVQCTKSALANHTKVAWLLCVVFVCL